MELSPVHIFLACSNQMFSTPLATWPSGYFIGTWVYHVRNQIHCFASFPLDIPMISVSTIWWCSCVVFFCVVGRGCLLWPVHSLGKTLLAFACFFLYSKAKFACYSRCFLTSYVCIPVPYNEKVHHVTWLPASQIHGNCSVHSHLPANPEDNLTFSLPFKPPLPLVSETPFCPGFPPSPLIIPSLLLTP